MGAEPMIPKTCLLIKTKKFPILTGEDEEIVNERMYEKALCQSVLKKPVFNLWALTTAFFDNQIASKK